MLELYTDKNGELKHREIDEQIIEQPIDYDAKVVELIRQKYSIDEELALNSKSMQIFLNNCTSEQKNKWQQEIVEFTSYRLYCIEQAKIICNK